MANVLPTVSGGALVVERTKDLLFGQIRPSGVFMCWTGVGVWMSFDRFGMVWPYSVCFLRVVEGNRTKRVPVRSYFEWYSYVQHYPIA